MRKTKGKMGELSVYIVEDVRKAAHEEKWRESLATRRER